MRPHSTDYTHGSRSDLTDPSTTLTVDTTGRQHADASDGDWGVALCYLQPFDDTVAVTFCDPHLIMTGNDDSAFTGATPTTMPAGTAYTDIQPTLDGLVQPGSTRGTLSQASGQPVSTAESSRTGGSPMSPDADPRLRPL